VWSCRRRWPQQGEHLAAADLEVDAVESLDAVIGLAHAADADGGVLDRPRAGGHGGFEGVRDHAPHRRAPPAARHRRAEIADRLVVSAATVKTHVNHIFAKAGVRDRAQAVVYAYSNGITARTG